MSTGPIVLLFVRGKNCLLQFDCQDIQLRLPSLPPPRGSPSTRLTLSQSLEAPSLVLQQLVSVRNLVNQSLDIVDVSTYTGNPLDATFIFSQLHLLHETISEARQMLKGEGDVRGNWWDTSASDNVSHLSNLKWFLLIGFYP